MGTSAGHVAIKAAMACGASVLAMTMFAGTAQAQAQPGSPECPVVVEVVTCSGSLSEGVSVASGTFDGLTIQSVAGDMSGSNRTVLQYRAGRPKTTILLDDPDSTIRLNTTEGAGTDFLVAGSYALAPTNSEFSLTSNIDIVITEANGAGNESTVRVPMGILVDGSGGTFNIVNSGDIALSNVSDSDASAIGVNVHGADLITVRNSGTLSTGSVANEPLFDGRGIVVAADNRRIEIVNEGSINLPSNLFANGIHVEYRPFDDNVPGVTRPTSPAMAFESYRIVNSGTIQAQDRGIQVENIFFQGANPVSLGTPSGEVINSGVIRAEFGMVLRHLGNRNIVNSGTIENRALTDPNEPLTFQGIVLGAPATAEANVPVGTTRIENTATGIIRSAGVLLPVGITIRDTPATIINAGLISIGTQGGAGFGISIIAEGSRVGINQITNSGTIQTAGSSARAIWTDIFDPAQGLVPDTRITNSGLIQASGSNATAIYLSHNNAGGISTIDLGASSVVRGGSGTGDAIRIVGGERHSILNAGLITAPSGLAIVGGAGTEMVDNSGRIEGSVALAGGDDALTMRAGGVQMGALDGGAGNDTLLFDIVSGEASVAGAISNWETVRKTGAGILTLRDTGTIPGLSFAGGTLLAEGNLGTTAISAPGGTILGGSGSLGAVTIADGATLSPGGAGSGVGTLTMSSLTLSGTSRLLFNLGAPGQVGGADNDLITVTGNLTLDGLLDIAPRAAFGTGVYRLIDYGGALTDNGLVIGNAPSTGYEIQTSVAGQVNLVVGALDDLSIQFWDDGDTSPDGMVDGGAGTWSTGRTNWTNLGGTANNAWAGKFAVFQNAGGTVMVEGQQGVTGMQFMANGYRLGAGAGGAVSLNAAETVIRVDPNVIAELALPLVGTGALVKRDLGMLLLSGTNSYSAGTVVREGVLRVGADAALGAAAGGVTLDGGTLRFDGAGSSARAFTIGAGGGTVETPSGLTLSGAIGGSGAFTKTGAGTLILTGNSSGFTGTTLISGGLLDITGSLGGFLTVGSGARLGGTGTVGNLTIASGGILAPGNSPGTLSAAGNVVFRAGSFYDLEIAAAGGRDLLAAAGTVTIEGGTVRVTALDPETQYVDGTRYTFLTGSGGLTGTFAGLSETSAFLDFVLGYDAASAFITVNVIRTFPDVAETFNQQQASAALMEFNTGAADALSVYNQLLLLDAAPARAAFDLASGEIYAVTLATALRHADREAERLLGISQASSGEGWGVWGSLSGEDGDVEGDGNGAAFDHDAIRGTFGADYRGSANRWAVGFGGGYWKADATLADRASRADSDGWHVGAYTRFGSGGSGSTATVSGAYVQGEAEVARTVSAGTISRVANSRVETTGWSLAGELRFGIDVGGGLALGPLGRVSAAHGSLGRFSETGAESLGLTSDNGNDDSRTRYGGGLFARWSGSDGSVDLTAVYVTGDGDPTEIDLAMAGASAVPYRVRAARGESEGLQLGSAGRYALGGGWSIGSEVSLFTSGAERQLTVHATLGWRF